MSRKSQVIRTQEEFDEIISKPIPEPEDLLEPLSKFHSILYDAFGYSLVRTIEALKKTHSRKSIKWFKPQAIRFYVHDFLGQKGLKSQLIDENDDEEEEREFVFKPRVSSNNGIAGNIDNYEYIILKIFNGGLPPPMSKPRREYYSQQHLKEYKLPLPGLGYTVKDILLKPNLVYLWDIVKEKGKKKKQEHIILYLAIPQHHLFYSTTKLLMIPNPITTFKQEDIDDAEENEQQNGELNDIRRTHQASS